VRRAILSAVLLAVALVLQLTVVNRLPLPGTGPDLVLLAVVALGLRGGPAAGALTGFCAGLGLDLAPPGSYLAGEYALVFCVIGYLCGRLRGSLNQSALLTIALAMTAAAAGEALYAAVGVVVSDPQVTWSVVRQVLPSAVIYDVAVTPFLLYGVLRAVGWADGLGRNAPGDRQADGAALLARGAGRGAGLPGIAPPGRPVRGGARLGGAGLLGGAGWLAGPVGSSGSRGPRAYRGGARRGATVHIPRTPRLRQAAARPGDGWLRGGPRTGLPASARHGPGRPGRPPRLRPGSGAPGSAAARPPRALPRSPATPRIAAPRRRDGNVGRALGAGPASRGRGSGPPGSAFRNHRPSVGAASGRYRSGAPSHGPRFRPHPRLRGGSSSAEMLRAGIPRNGNGTLGKGALRGGAFRGGVLRGGVLRGAVLRGGGVQRMGLVRAMTLRLGTGRRHDGVLGGGGTVGLGGLRGGTRRGLAARPARLRLGGGRRGDGTLGGGVLTRARSRLGARRAAPRFRSSPAVGGRSRLGRRTRLGAGQRARFTPGRTSFLATLLAHGRPGRRSTAWRVGSRRTGGLR
jgi:rod shape-determining protein MreD